MADRRVRLSRVAGEDSRFLDRYDFGDDWREDVLIEKGFPAEPDRRYLASIDGRRGGQPEDCGEPLGYAEHLEVRADRAEPRHREYREWVGDFFDPEAFDPADFDEHVRTLRALRQW